MDKLREILNSNRLPAMFVGSGISKRYLNNMPDWDELLINICKRIDMNSAQYYAIKQKINADNMQMAKLATKIEDIVLNKVIDGSYNIENDLNEKYRAFIPKGVSYLKLLIAFELDKLTLRNSEKMNCEIESLRNSIKNVNNIFTTNFDCFFEDYIIDKSFISLFEKQSDLYFTDTFGIGEMYKIHGSINNPKSLIINENDYNTYLESMNIFVSKLYNTLLNRPVIFLGYSLNDSNIIRILEEFIKHFPIEKIDVIAKNLIFVQYERDINELVYSEAVFQVGSKQVKMTQISTDNYALIYDTISEVKEGISAREIKRYENVIYDIIKNHEETGEKVFIANALDINKVDSKKLVLAIYPKYDNQMPIKGLVGEDTITFIEHALYNNNQIMFDEIATKWVEKRLSYNHYFPIYYIERNISENLVLGDKFIRNKAEMESRFEKIRTHAFKVNVDLAIEYESEFNKNYANPVKDLKDVEFEHALILAIRKKIDANKLREYLVNHHKKNNKYLFGTGFKKAVCYLEKI